MLIYLYIVFYYVKSLINKIIKLIDGLLWNIISICDRYPLENDKLIPFIHAFIRRLNAALIFALTRNVSKGEKCVVFLYGVFMDHVVAITMAAVLA